jgi:predicted  nucleic acid-binding Zn-ribbon protein
MASGVPETEVFQAADRVLARGQRPTVERVRHELGRGSPARVGQLLDQWWDRLAKRLAGETRLPDLPTEVAAAFKSAWTVASENAAATAEQSLAEARQNLEQDKASLTSERQRWSADLDSTRADVAAAKNAQLVAEQRFADHQRLVEQLQTELRDVRAQRDKLQEQADILVQDMMRLGAKLEKQEKTYAAERVAAAAHIRTVEDRAHGEVDRAREEAKAMRNGLTQLERTSQTARDAAAREHKEHVARLRTAERDASAHRARADALENQLKRLTQIAGKPRASVASRRTQKKVRSPRGTAN